MGYPLAEIGRLVLFRMNCISKKTLLSLTIERIQCSQWLNSLVPRAEFECLDIKEQNV